MTGKKSGKRSKKRESLLKRIKTVFTTMKVEVNICKIGKAFLWLIYDFTGIRFLKEKLLPPPPAKIKEKRKPSTLLLWVVGIYVALFGITSQLYENRVDIIENRANAIYAQLATPAYKQALSMISRVQNMECPQKPYILKPGTVFGSLLGSPAHYDEIVDLLKKTVENWKDKLDGVNLFGAKLQSAHLSYANLKGALLWKANLHGAYLQSVGLQEANLWGANLRESIFSRANFQVANLQEADFFRADLEGANLKKAWLYRTDLSEAKGLTIEQLLEVGTLYKVKGLDPKLEAELKKRKPELFQNPEEL